MVPGRALPVRMASLPDGEQARRRGAHADDSVPSSHWKLKPVFPSGAFRAACAGGRAGAGCHHSPFGPFLIANGQLFWGLRNHDDAHRRGSPGPCGGRGWDDRYVRDPARGPVRRVSRGRAGRAGPGVRAMGPRTVARCADGRSGPLRLVAGRTVSGGGGLACKAVVIREFGPPEVLEACPRWPRVAGRPGRGGHRRRSSPNVTFRRERRSGRATPPHPSMLRRRCRPSWATACRRDGGGRGEPWAGRAPWWPA